MGAGLVAVRMALALIRWPCADVGAGYGWPRRWSCFYCYFPMRWAGFC